MPRPSAKPLYRPLSQFVLRSPLLPFSTLSDGTDEQSRRAALHRLVADPVVREALHVASPELDAKLPGWAIDPEAPTGVAVERALVRYVSRMASRSKPFGQFATVAVGSLGAHTELALAPRAAARRHTRLDHDLLFALCAELVRDPEVRARLRYWPNSSLYDAAGQLCYAEARLAGRARVYHLMAVDRSRHLDAALARARGGATRDELIEVLSVGREVTRDEARAFVDQIIDVQIVVPELAPTVTGREPADAMIATLEARQLDAMAAPLRAARDALRELDTAVPGAPVEIYRAIERQIAATLPTRLDASRLFQVDLYRPTTAVLGQDVTGELMRAVEELRSVTAVSDRAGWQRFRERFVARYATREVPLLEVLDEEVGIGLGDERAGSTPLLAGLAFPARGSSEPSMIERRDGHLMALVSRAMQTRAIEIELTDHDIAQLCGPAPAPLPAVFAVQAQLAAASSDAVADGRYQLCVDGVSRGADLLARFCHGSPEVTELAERCARAEEVQRPDAVFAEVVHLPEGRAGNLLLRPLLREYEIPYLGASGADRDHQIDVSDLAVSVVGDRVVLRSRRLGREVFPRLTAVHDHTSPRNLAVYRFLCAHADQNVGGAQWSWGFAEGMPFLPRVRRGKVVYARARWRLTRADLAPIESALHAANAARTPDQVRASRTRVVAAVAELRQRLRLPRWVVATDGDHELPIDLDNELMVDSAAHLLKGRDGATLTELFPAPAQLCAVSPEGAFCHELVVLVENLAATRAQPAAAGAGSSARESAPVVRRFLPGSPWLYLKLYTGNATADRVLRDHLATTISHAAASGLTQRWFFVRHADPDVHLRLWFSGEPQRLTGELLPALHEALAHASERGLVWKVVIDTYEREIERYGGAAAIELAEAAFHADSACVLGLLPLLAGDTRGMAWRLALHGIDRLMTDLGFARDSKLAVMTRATAAFGTEAGIDTVFHKGLDDKYRTHRAEIAALVDGPADDRLLPALAKFAARSSRLRAVGEQLRALDAAGQLGKPLEDIAHRYLQMHVNRMLHSAPRLHEIVLYDLLRRHYEGAVGWHGSSRPGRHRVNSILSL